MAEDPVYRSRLQTSPTKGIGAGYAENQRIAGARDPKQAAKLAIQPEAERIAETDASVAASADFEAMCEDLAVAAADGVYAPPSMPVSATKSVKEALAWLKVSAPSDVAFWHAEAQGAYDQKMRDDDDAVLRTQIQSLGVVDPADPLYDPMTDQERRKSIEAGLEPLSFEEMVFKGYTSQVVKVRENFVLTFRTLSTQHGLWLEWMMAQTPESSLQHTRHTYSLMMLAASLDAVNGKPTGPDLTKYVKDDATSRDSFVTALNERMAFLGRLPSMLTDDLIIQGVWFQGRVRRVLAGDILRKVGNS